MPLSTNIDIEVADDVIAYLRNAGFIGVNEAPIVRALAGGVSNKTVLVKRQSGEAWVLKQALPKLRVAADWYCSPDRIHREADGMRELAILAPVGTIPRLVSEDIPNHLLMMDAVPQPHENWKTLLMNGEAEPDHVAQFGRLLATIHRHSRLHRDSLADLFDDRSFFESLRIEPYYAYALSRVPEAAFLADLIDRTRRRRYTIVHGDFSPKNILVYQQRLILLDHEVIHFGDPAFDVGFSLTHFLSKAHHLPNNREAFLTQAGIYWDVYRSVLGDAQWDPEIERFAVLHTMGCLLARVAGRSPLEYLSEAERDLQHRIVVSLARKPPSTVRDVIAQFAAKINHANYNYSFRK